MTREFVFSEAQAMVPLVRSILGDVVTHYGRLAELEERYYLLRGCRRGDYELRRQFYAVEDDLRAARDHFDAAVEELEGLGAELIDPVKGIAGFAFNWSPRVGSSRIRRATFLLKLSDDPSIGIKRWRFEGERTEHRVPRHWAEDVRPVTSGEVGSIGEV